jgi:hypothetical protein
MKGVPAMAETVYCDNYDELAGNVYSATVQAPETKVVKAPKHAAAKASDVEVDTKAAE